MENRVALCHDLCDIPSLDLGQMYELWTNFTVEFEELVTRMASHARRFPNPWMVPVHVTGDLVFVRHGVNHSAVECGSPIATLFLLPLHPIPAGFFNGTAT